MTQQRNRQEEPELATPGQMVQPGLSVLRPEQIDLIHRESLHLLSTAGVRIDSDRARQLFSRALGTPLDPAQPVRVPPDLVEWALQSAPNTVDVFDRQGRQAFHLPGCARFGVGVTALYYQDPQADHVTPFARPHMGDTVRLAGALSNYDVVSTVGILQDVPPHAADLYATLEMTAHTTKPLVILVSDEASFPAVLDLLEHLHGDLATRPFVLPYVNPVTPLMINRGTVDKMGWAMERGLPVIYSNYGMAGATTPLAAAGSLVLLNAELLAGLTLSQLIRQGAPILLGSLPAVFDMRGMGSFYESHSYLVNLACAEMMAHYRLPHCGTSGSGMGWGPDLIAAGHQWFNHLVSCMGKVGLAPFVGDNLGAKAFSPALIVLADEVIERARAFARGFALDDDAMASHEIVEAGPGGSFLLSASTLRSFRTAYVGSRIFPQLTLEEWQRRQQPRAQEFLRQHTRELLETATPPADRDALLEEGEAFIQQWARGRS